MALQVLAALAGGPLEGPVEIDAFRCAFPFKLTYPNYEVALTGAVRAVSVLPAGFLLYCCSRIGRTVPARRPR